MNNLSRILDTARHTIGFVLFPIIIYASGCATDLSALGEISNRGSDLDRSRSPSALKIIVIDVGQGDATLIVTPLNEAILIDGGPTGSGFEIIAPLLAINCDWKLNTIITTHYHMDHIAGIVELITGRDGSPDTGDEILPREGIYDRGNSGIDSNDELFASYARASGKIRRTLRPGDELRLGDLVIEAIAADGKGRDGDEAPIGDPPDENARSIALMIVYSGFRMLIAADITGGGGNPPYETPDVESMIGPIAGDIDILRVAHHGSRSSTTDRFLDATTPEVAIISVGDDNDYFHPNATVIDRLIARGIEVYQTEQGWLKDTTTIIADGNIEIEIDDDGGYEISPSAELR